MAKDNNVYKNLMLISQMGINIIVPTFICLFIGILVSKLVGLWVVLPFILLGMGAGMRNCYIMAMNANKKTRKKNESDGEN